MKPKILKSGFILSIILFIFLSSCNSAASSLENSNYFNRKYVEYVDDIPPTIEIIYPESGFYYVTLFGINFKIPIPSDIVIINCRNNHFYVEVNATDNIGVESVTFYIDGEMRAIDYEYPYIWLWEEHSMMILLYELKVTARDYAGNEASDVIKVWRGASLQRNQS